MNKPPQVLSDILSGETLDGQAFIKCYEGMTCAITKWAVRKGFWEHREALVEKLSDHPDSWNNLQALVEKLVKYQKLLLVVTELAEAAEGIRDVVAGEEASKVDGFTNEEEEVADAVIRLMDYGGYYNLKIAACIQAKMAVNEQRPTRHGKVF